MRDRYDTLDEWIEDLKEQGSIHEFVIGKGICLSSDFHAGKICCLFHSEKTGSLQITDRWYKCYGCGIKGDFISFVQNYYNMDFLEAVRYIAEYYKVSLPTNHSFNKKKSALQSEWESYLQNVDKAPDVVKKYQRMFFPQEIGYDSKLKYIVCPLVSKGGNILGFTKRRVDELLIQQDGSFPKYAPKWKHSSADDSLISQCHNVYNLNLGSRAIRSTNEVIVCEGPKDAIAYRRDGLEQVVGVCGTSNGNNIWDVIPFSERVYLSMDGDSAGKKATIQAIQFLVQTRELRNIYVIQMPDSVDPYDLLLQDGPGSLLKAKEKAMNACEWFIKNASHQEATKLYHSVPEYTKRYVIKYTCSANCMSALEAESWLLFHEDTSKDIISHNDEVENLRIWAEGGDVPGLVSMPADKAKRILRMKYGG